jgi:hypothetical protein
MIRYLAREVEGLSFHDSTINGIIWEKGGEDLCLALEWLPAKNRPGLPTGQVSARLAFQYVTDLVLDVKFINSMGAPSIYSTSFSSLPLDRWQVEIVFLGLPDGEIRFECNDLSLLVEDEAEIQV